MKRIFILLALCLGVSIAKGQAVGFYVSDGVVLNGNQWHYDNLSIIDAGGSNYLVITPTEYYYSYLPPLYTPSVNYIIDDVAISCRPYSKYGEMGWWVHARYGDYFVFYVSNAWHSVRISAVPVCYNYSYHLCGVRYIDMRLWHFAPPPGPRHHHGTPPPSSGPRPHHHHGTPPPSSGHHGHGTTPPTHSGNTTPPPSSHRGGSVSGSQRGSGTSVRPTNPPSNGNGSVRSSNPPSGGNRGSSVRPSGSSSGGSRSGGFSPGSSHSSGRSSGVSAPHPSSGGRSSTPTRSSGGSPRRR